MSDQFEDEVAQRLTALEAWQDAAVTKMKRLGEENERLRDRIAELEKVVDPDPGHSQYEKLTRKEKVHRLRKALLKDAITVNGLASMKYREVMALFNNNPSAGHCYDLMKRAGSLEGFEYAENRGGNKVIRVESASVKDEALVHAVNKGTEGVTA